MARLRRVALNQVTTSMEALVTAGKITKVYIEPESIFTASEWPAVWIRPGADDSEAIKTFPGSATEVVSKILIGIIGALSDETIAKDLEDTIDDVKGQIMADRLTFAGLSPRVIIQGVPVVVDPVISSLIGPLATATVAVQYRGQNTY